MTCKCHGGEESLAHYSPWSCSTISPFESEPHHLSTHSCSKQLVSGRFIALIYFYNGLLNNTILLIPLKAIKMNMKQVEVESLQIEFALKYF